MRTKTIVRFCLAGFFLLGAISVVHSQCMHCMDPVQKQMSVAADCANLATWGMTCVIQSWMDTAELTGPIPTSQPNPGCDSRQATYTEIRIKTTRSAICQFGMCTPLGPPQYSYGISVHPCLSPNCEMNCGD